MKYFERLPTLLIFLTLVQIACTPVSPSASNTRTRGDESVTEFNSEFDAKSAFQNHVTSCKQKESCSDSTATMLSLFEKKKLGRCAASLVSKDLVVTNSHCIPDEIKSNPALCTQQMKFLFPESRTYSKSETFCKSIVGFVNPNNTANGIDLAYIKLDSKIDRTILPVDITGIRDDEFLLVSKSNPVDDNRSEIEFLKCQAKQGSSVASRFVDKISRTFALGNCNIVHGNSGSPVISESGSLKGVVSYIIPNRDDSKLPAAGGTSFSCAPFPGEENPNAPQPNCSVSVNELIQDKVNSAFTSKLFSSARDLKNEISVFAQHFFDNAKTQSIRWKFVATVLRNQGPETVWWLKPIPICFNSKNALLSEEADNASGLKQNSEIQISKNIFTIKIGSNQFYQPVFQSKVEALNSPLVLKYSPLAIGLYNQTPAMLNNETFHLEKCANSQTGYELDLKLLSSINLRIDLGENSK